MERLINLSTLCIGGRKPNAFNYPEMAYGWNDLLKILEAAPTVDAVEVVRCRDCKHYNEGFCVGYHAHHDSMPDDFCSYGEQKDGDGNG